MDKFEEKLTNLEVPEIKDTFLHYELKEKLERKYFHQKFKLPYRIAFGSALAMFLFTLSVVIKPDIATSINYAFTGDSDSQLVANSKIDAVTSEGPATDQWKGFEGLAMLDNQNPRLKSDDLQAVSDTTNDNAIQFLDPDDFEEGKVYMIRRYKSQDKQGVIMINEMEDRGSARGKIRKISR